MISSGSDSVAPPAAPGGRITGTLLLGVLKTVFLTIAITCLAFNLSLTSKQKVIESKISAIEDKMEALRASSRISGDELRQAEDVLKSLHYPILFDPWLLRFNGLIGAGCIIAHSVLMFVSLRMRKIKADGPLNE